MCKFTNRLFVFTLLALLSAPKWLLVDSAATRAHQKDAAKAKFLDLLSLNDDDNNYDVHYDQRQKGDENLHVRMDGFFIEMPSDDTEGAAEDLLKDIREELLLGLADVQASKSSTSSPERLQQAELGGALKENNLDTDLRSNTQQRDAIEAVLKHELEGRNAPTYQRSELVAANREPEASKSVGVITKQHFNTLLNFLKRMRRN